MFVCRLSFFVKHLDLQKTKNEKRRTTSYLMMIVLL